MDFIDAIFERTEQVKAYNPISETGAYTLTLKNVRYRDKGFEKFLLYFDKNGETVFAEMSLYRRDGSPNKKTLEVISKIASACEEFGNVLKEGKRSGSSQLDIFSKISGIQINREVMVEVDVRKNGEYVNPMIVGFKFV